MTVSTPPGPAFLSRVCIGILLLLTFLTTASAASAAPALSTASPAEVTQQQHEDEHDLQPRATKPFLLRVMPLGASITVGYMSSDGNGYRKYLREQLRYAGWGVDMVGSLANGTMNDNVRHPLSLAALRKNKLKKKGKEIDGESSKTKAILATQSTISLRRRSTLHGCSPMSS